MILHTFFKNNRGEDPQFCITPMQLTKLYLFLILKFESVLL